MDTAKCTLLFTLQKYGCHFVSSLYTIQSVHTPFNSPILSTNQKYEKKINKTRLNTLNRGQYPIQGMLFMTARTRQDPCYTASNLEFLDWPHGNQSTGLEQFYTTIIQKEASTIHFRPCTHQHPTKITYFSRTVCTAFNSTISKGNFPHNLPRHRIKYTYMLKFQD